jgi:hypothetical protein
MPVYQCAGTPVSLILAPVGHIHASIPHSRTSLEARHSLHYCASPPVCALLSAVKPSCHRSGQYDRR